MAIKIENRNAALTLISSIKPDDPATTGTDEFTESANIQKGLIPYYPQNEADKTEITNIVDAFITSVGADKSQTHLDQVRETLMPKAVAAEPAPVAASTPTDDSDPLDKADTQIILRGMVGSRGGETEIGGGGGVALTVPKTNDTLEFHLLADFTSADTSQVDVTVRSKWKVAKYLGGPFKQFQLFSPTVSGTVVLPTASASEANKKEASVFGSIGLGFVDAGPLYINIPTLMLTSGDIIAPYELGLKWKW